jgi:hypothetical protein
MHPKSAYVALSCAALAISLMTAARATARVFPHKQCELDTSKVEAAMQSTPELSALDKQVQDDFHRLMRLARGPDGRYVAGNRQADWLCDVERQCGRYASIEAGMGRCLQDAMRKRAEEIELFAPQPK